MTRPQKTPSESTRRSSAGASSVAERPAGRRAADPASRTRSALKWILLIALLIV
jgi:hypothetical protein